MVERLKKMDQAAKVVGENLDKSYEEVSNLLSKELNVPFEKAQGYYRHVVIHQMAKDAEGKPLPRVWVKRGSASADASGEARAPRTRANQMTSVVDEIVKRVTDETKTLLEKTFQELNESIIAGAGHREQPATGARHGGRRA